MAFKRLSPEAKYVTYGFGQVEPNHLSAQRTGEIYAQLPAHKDIKILENGQFAKYDYLTGTVNFAGKGEWMLIYNEVKVYAPWETDQDFAMIARDYSAHVYSPVGVTNADGTNIDQSQLMKKIGAETDVYGAGYADAELDPTVADDFGRGHLKIGRSYEIENLHQPQLLTNVQGMMTPRLFKTHEGDIFTTNTLADETVALGDILAPNARGYLAKTEATEGMLWQVVKLYNLGDMQKAVKVMRIQ